MRRPIRNDQILGGEERDDGDLDEDHLDELQAAAARRGNAWRLHIMNTIFALPDEEDEVEDEHEVEDNDEERIDDPGPM